MSVVRHPLWFIGGYIFILMMLIWHVQSRQHIYHSVQLNQAESVIPFSSLHLFPTVQPNHYGQHENALVATKAVNQNLISSEPINLPLPPSTQDGKVVSWYANKQKKMEGSYNNGKPEGQWRIWYANGQIAMETYWHNGFPEGKAITWYANGNKKGELNFIQGRGEGRWRRWFDNGQLSQDMMVHQGEVQTLTSWDKSGRLMADIAIQNQKQNGVVLTWYPSGAKKSESIFKQDELIKKTEWDEEGNVINLGNDGD